MEINRIEKQEMTTSSKNTLSEGRFSETSKTFKIMNEFNESGIHDLENCLDFIFFVYKGCFFIFPWILQYYFSRADKLDIDE